MTGPIGLVPTRAAGLFAFRVDNGERMWQTPRPAAATGGLAVRRKSAAITAIAGAVFSGFEDGHLRAYSTANGKIIWDFDTAAVL